MTNILLFSGGMDSFIGWHFLGKPNCLFVNLGHRYAKFEEEKVEAFSESLGLQLEIMHAPEVGLLFEEDNANIPLRNLLLATLGAMFADTVYLVCQEGERTIPDRSPEFFASLSATLTIASGVKKSVDPVFWNMTKVEMVAWYKEQRLPTMPLLKTFSCFNSKNGEPCAACAACFRRAQALLLNNFSEPWYRNLKSWSGLLDYKARLEAGEYPGKRGKEMKHALDLLGVK